MLSVTSDVAASASYANAPIKPVLPDPSRVSGAFAALLNTNSPGDIIGALPPEPPPQQPANDAPAAPNPAASSNPAPANQTPPAAQSAQQTPPPFPAPLPSSTFAR